MQLNVYVPRDKEGVLRSLDNAARSTGRAKNLLVLEAIERYLRDRPLEKPRVLRTFNLGGMQPWNRADLYDERIEHILGGGNGRVAEEKGAYKAEQ